jgi:hypothetical protein
VLRWPSRRALAEAFAPKETVGTRLTAFRDWLSRRGTPPVIPTKSIAANLILMTSEPIGIAPRYDTCANNFLSAVRLVALVCFWLRSRQWRLRALGSDTGNAGAASTAGPRQPLSPELSARYERSEKSGARALPIKKRACSIE